MILVTFCLLLPIPPHFTKNLHNNSPVPTSLLRTFIVLVTTSIERSPISTHSQHHEKGQPIKMSGIVHHLVSRGYEEAHDRFKGQPQPISPWKVASLFVTVIVYMLAMFAVRSIPQLSYLSVAAVLTAFQDRVHIRLHCCHLGHGRNTHGHRIQARCPTSR